MDQTTTTSSSSSSSIKLELLKNKKENAQSAIASQEVREHLAGFIRSKRQGSINQINNIQHYSANQQRAIAGSFSNNTGINNNTPKHLSTGGESLGSEDADHPLRKTASMPTMHIPYKAQSLSRRRQIARRTTMSPLMKRKSKPKRQLLHSQGSNSAEYSSNPCIIQSTTAAENRALSRSSSPQPFSSHQVATDDIRERSSVKSLHFNNQDPLKVRSTLTSCSSQSSIPTSIAQTITLSAIFTNSELESIQNNLKSSMYFPTTTTATATTPITNNLSCSHQGDQQQQHKELSTNSSATCLNQTSLDNQQSFIRHQQHLKVNEVVRKTVIERASSRNRIIAGGSLDIEASSSSAQLGNEGKSFRGNGGEFRDELRQWSLDGADPRTNATLNRLSASGSISTAFHRELYKRRLATTTDAATLRRSQSPSSSISMGVCATNQQHQHPFSPQSSLAKPGAGKPSHVSAGVHGKNYSSSSSSTSSLLSQQDSFEDSSSQAIDLSSSSERQRHQQQQQQPAYGVIQNTPPKHHLIHNSAHSNPNNQQQYCQKVLQESFKQLQLCQQSQEEIQQLFLSSANQMISSNSTTNSAINTTNTSNVTCNPLLKQASNLISPPNQPVHLNQPIVTSGQEQSLSKQVLDTTTRNLPIYAQQQQQPLDYNQWLLANKTNIPTQSGMSSELQLANSVLTNMATNLPEPYKSSLLAQLIRQQQLSAGNLNSTAGNFTRNVQLRRANQEDSRLLFGRTLSSPLLISGNADHHHHHHNVTPSLASTQREHQTARLSNGASFTLGDRNDNQLVDMLVDEDDNNNTSESRVNSETKEFLSKLESSNINTLDLTVPSKLANVVQNEKILTELLKSGSFNPKTSAQYQQQQASFSFIYDPKFDNTSSTGLIYDLEMCNHKCICANESNHPENSYRILAIWRRLYEKDLMSKCALVEGRKASLEEIQLCHSETYSNYFGKSPYERIKLSHLDLSKLPIEGLTQLECGGQGADIDTAWNEEQTPGVARLAAGCVIEAAISVAAGRLMNAFAVVRPPGHHAESQQAMGFCFFNSIAIAARVLISKHRLARVLIVDWDVHHGNGIQKLFYEDKRVMYISLHRHDKGNFFPGTGDVKEVGYGLGEGYNWNIAWSNESMGDAEYLAAFRSLVMPIALDFNPSMVLVACGFDAARGHSFNFGGYNLTPACYAYMTRQLMSLANGRLVLCLEGGYELNIICDCAESCVRALLNESHMINSMDQISESELRREPNQSACEILYEVSNLAVRYWPSIARWRCMIEQSAIEAANLRC